MPAWEALKAAKQPLEETETDGDAPRQLWIVRGVDAATGVPLVRGPWRDDSKVTLDTGFPPPTAAAHNLDSVRRAVETALPATGPARREAVARELDAFLNRMRKGDIVLSTDGFETYVGVVDGPAVHTAERLERPVDWRKPEQAPGLPQGSALRTRERRPGRGLPGPGGHRVRRDRPRPDRRHAAHRPAAHGPAASCPTPPPNWPRRSTCPTPPGSRTASTSSAPPRS
ncbi:hypothetical protein GCM10023238_02490 [Streptomyces heliomycini]